MRPRPVIALLSLLVCHIAPAQVLDVDGDGIVGPQEALALAQDWRKGASGGSSNLVLDLTVAPGETVSQGDVVSLTTGGLVKGGIVVRALGVVSETPLPESNLLVAAPVIRLSENRFVLCYDISGPAGEKIVVGTLVGDSIEFGAPIDLSANNLNNRALTTLSESKFAVAYRDSGDGNKGKVRMGTISGDTITLRGEEVFNDGNTTPISITGISENRFVVAYRDIPNSSAGTARVGFDHPIQGLLLSPETAFETGGIGGNTAIGALSGTKVLILYSEGSAGRAVAGTVVIPTPLSTGALTYGATETVAQEPSIDFSVIPLSSSTAAVGFVGSMSISKLQLVTVTGTDLTPGVRTDLFPSSTSALSLGLMAPDKVVAGLDTGAPGVTGAAVASIENTTIRVGPSLSNPATRLHSLVPLGEDRVVFFDGQDGRAVLARATPISITMGIAQEAGTAGQSIPVLVSGVSEVHAGLTPGSFYFGQPDGSLDTSFTDAPIGMALSPSTLLVGTGPAGP
ncbi:MAG: hypothetical protein HUU16_08075 [Candidatus Omnitrophica bacterium]|nr:hypothetical protein [Candidatus Omnitrophota bacterium]